MRELPDGSFLLTVEYGLWMHMYSKRQLEDTSVQQHMAWTLLPSRVPAVGRSHAYVSTFDTLRLAPWAYA